MSRITVLDGGMGRELQRIGAPFRQPEWSALALMEAPDRVVEAHNNFISSGASIITTNSYAVVPFHIGDERFAKEGQHLADLAGRLARRAADASPVNVQVAGSLPPLFGSYLPELFDEDAAQGIIDALVYGQAPHVDIWLGETLGSIAEATAVRAALERIIDRKPMWISYTLSDAANGTLRSGEQVDAAVRAAMDLGAEAVLFNCSQAESITAALKIAAPLIPAGVQTGGYANRFLSSHTSKGEANEHLSAFRDDLSPHEYGAIVSNWIELGATVVGGCCGMTPQHISELSRLVSSP
jgi:S-methylmethionine-dependent homocysteine/selenocysteine methylase